VECFSIEENLLNNDLTDPINQVKTEGQQSFNDLRSELNNMAKVVSTWESKTSKPKYSIPPLPQISS
jgi:hypothetical protein